MQPNFKPSKTERMKQKRQKDSAYQRRQKKDAAHLEAIRRCPCCIPGCANTDIEAHHLKQFMDRGMGMKAENKWTVPLCHEHHINGVERVASSKEHEWFQAHGISNPIDLASALYFASQDDRVMHEIIREAHGRNG